MSLALLSGAYAKGSKRPHIGVNVNLGKDTSDINHFCVKAPLHDTIRPHGACRLPCTWVNRSV